MKKNQEQFEEYCLIGIKLIIMTVRNLSIILLFKFNHNYEVFFVLQCTSILRVKNLQLSQKDTCSIAL